jgi:hypothetical protein
VRALALVLGGAVAACTSVADVPPLGDYLQWKRLDTYGPAPGHGDTYRVIYANAVARRFAGGQYADGAVLVKEIYTNDDDQPGALQYIAIMRRIGPAPAAGTDDDGWVFTEIRGGKPEVAKSTCWRRCHIQAPYAGAWLRYGD